MTLRTSATKVGTVDRLLYAGNDPKANAFRQLGAGPLSDVAIWQHITDLAQR